MKENILISEQDRVDAIIARHHKRKLAEQAQARVVQKKSSTRVALGSIDLNNNTAPSLGGLQKKASSVNTTTNATVGKNQPIEQYKVLVVGNAKCGKTSVIQRYANGVFDEKYKTTIGADFVRKETKTEDGSKVRLQLWDIAGQDRFARLTRLYFRRAKGAIVVCDVTREGTFEAAGKWKQELDRMVADTHNVPVSFTLLL